MDNLKYEIEEEARAGARIKVIGVGGGGCNAVSRMVQDGLSGVEFHALNTDLQALSACAAPNKLQIGAKLTKGLGTGSNPDMGRQAALDSTDEIVEILQGADMVFVTAGMGGGTGTGAAPVIANLAKDLEALTVAVVTKPFGFEGPRRMRMAEEGLQKLAAAVDTVIAIPNDRLLSLAARGTSFVDAFKLADDLLKQAVQGISDIINSTGAINRDFSDVKAAMLGMGYAMLGTAVARGENAAVEAARQAINCPLLEESHIAGARSILMNITGSAHLGFHEVNEACSIVREAAQFPDVQLNFGIILNESMQDAVKITVIATGFQPDSVPQPERRVATPVVRVQEPEPEPEPVAAEPAAPAADPEPEFEPEPEPTLLADEEAIIDMDDLDTPAYLRQGRLLN
jgi:cell division protein FtsZ